MNPQGMPGVDERQVSDIVSDLGSAARELYQRVDLGREIEEHPYRTLAIAAGVGYVLAGGLFTPLTRSLLGIGVRVALVPMAKNALKGTGIEDEIFG